MKKTLSSIWFIIAAFLCFAFEGGGLIQTDIGFDFSSSAVNKPQDTVFTSFKNRERVSLWAKQNMDKDGNYNFSIQSSYFFTFSQVLAPQKKTVCGGKCVGFGFVEIFVFLFAYKEFKPFI